MKNEGASKRWLLWLPMLALAAWLAFFGDKSPTNQNEFVKPRSDLPSKKTSTLESSEKVAKTPTPVQQPSFVNKQVSETLAVEALIPRVQLISMRQNEKVAMRDLFSSRTWTPPPLPIKPPPPLAPTVPVAPPLPFAYIGKKLEADVWEVYLQRGEQSFLVRSGAILDSAYRVDSITPQRLNLTYLPLGQSQSLSIGDSQ